MANAIEEGELIEAIAVENALEIELQVCGSRRARRVPQQAQQHAICDYAPQVSFAVVQVFLHQRLRAKAASRRPAVEVAAQALDVYGRRFLACACPMRDR